MMDMDAKHAAEVRSTMDIALSQLSDLAETTDNNTSAQQKTDALLDMRDSSVVTAVYLLGNMASSPKTRMGSFLPSTAQFVKEQELGSGRHGVVVKARDSVTGETVAVKTLHSRPLYYSNLVHDEEVVLDIPHRVLREACFMAACRDHPSLVNLSAVGRDYRTGEYCLVMEHVGPSLQHVLFNQRGGKPFSEKEVRRMMRQVLGGAKAMHDRGVVHRNINLSSILVADGNSSVVKIGNFAEATSMSERVVSYYIARMSHVAPECLLRSQGATRNKVADSWSMGCLMMELLTGVRHFEVEAGGDREAQLYKTFHVLGIPGKETIKAIKPQNLQLAGEVQKWQARLRRLGKTQSSRLGELVHREVLSDDGFQVLQGLLECNPKKRLTAAAALQLPWFTDNTDDSSAASVSYWVRVGGMLALLFLMVFVYIRCRW